MGQIQIHNKQKLIKNSGVAPLDFTFLRYSFILLVLLYASFCDFREREVPNKVWYIAVPIGMLLVFTDFFWKIINLQSLIISIVFSIILGVSMFYIGFLGGADAKAIIFIGFTIPSYPIGFSPLLGDIFAIPVLTVFLNSLIISLSVPLWVFLTNLIEILGGKHLFNGVEASLLGKIVLFFTAKRISLEKLRKSLAYFPAEKPVKKGDSLIREPIYFIKAEEDVTKIINVLNEKQDIYVDGLLASPTIPLIIFITIGLVLLPCGNVFFWLISSVLNFS